MKTKLLLSIFVLFMIITGGLFYFEFLSFKISQPVVKQTENIVPVVVNTSALPVVNTKTETKTEVTEIKADPNKQMDEKISAIKAQASNINTKVLKLSLIAHQNAQKRGVINNPIITIIDYSKPSAERRLWVVDLDKNKVLFNTLVAHGKNSGTENSTAFSNRHNSLQSSIGVFVTNETYQGKHGNSLKVRGLESGVNNNAYDRSIVFHGASYVNNAIAKASGRVGRSWGCMAVSENIINPLIKTIKNKSLVFSYYPDKKWLNNSAFLN